MELYGTVHEDSDYVVFEDKGDIKNTRVKRNLVGCYLINILYMLCKHILKVRR